VTVQLFPAGASLPARSATFELAPGRSALVNVPSLFARFNGSAIVTARRFDGSRSLVGAHVFELAQGDDPGTTYNLAKAYVSFARGSSTMHMPTALCNAFGSIVSPAQSTAFAIQNIAPAIAHVKVTFLPGDASKWLTVPPGSKASLQTCDVVASGFSGSAEIKSDVNIVAMGKAFVVGQTPGTGTVTAFEGLEHGASELSVPYVRWSSNTDYYFSSAARASIAVQNTGNSTAPGVIARYFTTSGANEDVALGDIGAGAKANTNPSQLTNATILDSIQRGFGSVEILGPPQSDLSALVRVYRRGRESVPTPAISEDYMALARRQYLWCECELTIPNTSPAFL
jgi:hypothetical protein